MNDTYEGLKDKNWLKTLYTLMRSLGFEHRYSKSYVAVYWHPKLECEFMVRESNGEYLYGYWVGTEIRMDFYDFGMCFRAMLARIVEEKEKGNEG